MKNIAALAGLAAAIVVPAAAQETTFIFAAGSAPDDAVHGQEARAPLEAEWVKNTSGGDKMLAAYRPFLADATAGR